MLFIPPIEFHSWRVFDKELWSWWSIVKKLINVRIRLHYILVTDHTVNSCCDIAKAWQTWTLTDHGSTSLMNCVMYGGDLLIARTSLTDPPYKTNSIISLSLQCLYTCVWTLIHNSQTNNRFPMNSSSCIHITESAFQVALSSCVALPAGAVWALQGWSVTVPSSSSKT